MAVLVVVRWPLRPTPDAGPTGGRHPPVSAWVVLFAAVVAWELAEYASRGSRAAHPTLSSMLDAIDRYYLLKALIFFGWLYLGAAIVRKGTPAGAGGDVGRGAAGRTARGGLSMPLDYAVWAVLGLAVLGVWARSRTAPTPHAPCGTRAAWPRDRSSRRSAPGLGLGRLAPLRPLRAEAGPGPA